MTSVKGNEWLSRYSPPAFTLWVGRKDDPPGDRVYENITLMDLRQKNAAKSQNFGLLGLRSDEGVKRNLGRVGAFDGPSAFRKSFANLALPLNLQNKLVDFGDISAIDNDLEMTQEAFGFALEKIIRSGFTPFAIGGGHELSWAFYQGLIKAYPNEAITIINFDAHFDLRHLNHLEKGTSGTSFRQIALNLKKRDLPFRYLCLGIQSFSNTHFLFEQAKEFQADYVISDDFFLKGYEAGLPLIEQYLEFSSKIYVTICLDVFQAAIAPGVSAPQVLGIHPWHIIPLLRKLAESKKLVGFDIAELNPAFDQEDRTAKLAALLSLEMLNALSPKEKE